jgi:hypothetical protein
VGLRVEDHVARARGARPRRPRESRWGRADVPGTGRAPQGRGRAGGRGGAAGKPPGGVAGGRQGARGGGREGRRQGRARGGGGREGRAWGFKVGQQRVWDAWPSDHLYAPRLLLPQSGDSI